jgi:hypothetical protein
MSEAAGGAASAKQSTPVEVIANVSRVVTKVVDRISGDRVEVPLMTAAACVEALARFGIEARVMYGKAAWIELLEKSHRPTWAGCWGENYTFWVATQYGEVVDLNVSVAHRKLSHQGPEAGAAVRAALSPPMLWSAEVPAFYRYEPEGVAELELTDPEDLKRFQLVLDEVRLKCGPEHVRPGEQEFANEAILCPGRRVLDDSRESFRQFERAIGVMGLPAAPF